MLLSAALAAIALLDLSIFLIMYGARADLWDSFFRSLLWPVTVLSVLTELTSGYDPGADLPVIAGMVSVSAAVLAGTLCSTIRPGRITRVISVFSLLLWCLFSVVGIMLLNWDM